MNVRAPEMNIDNKTSKTKRQNTSIVNFDLELRGRNKNNKGKIKLPQAPYNEGSDDIEDARVNSVFCLIKDR